ncbi:MULTISPECIES: hypothetical protein [unclassified Ensifer]|uniref:hypothetical protein n=1 Tax=unclassified Ensifer TaxID=2633371 RepID=UPI000813773B|nr:MULTISPECIES: hypothetical protein [unclassified Ensifer]OCP07161.1 hypothetical protein BBX50_22600 [Ensifer sp. LC11]OCP07743.1 hypothetical protein BC374_22815 [Ensifer sp. LC13]OCP12095.1 hypothetical protein BC362_06465 [Ensifer sp. LC14]OCP31805.1 hypothetical protein BC364_21885 [Ensifer sp. LC499]
MLCALVLVVSAFVQQPAAAMPVAPAMAAYVLPDGTLADLCLTGHDDPDGKGGTKGHGCQSCCLVAPGALPTSYRISTPPHLPALPPSLQSNELVLVHAVLLTGAGPRAPPSAFSA